MCAPKKAVNIERNCLLRPEKTNPEQRYNNFHPCDLMRFPTVTYDEEWSLNKVV